MTRERDWESQVSALSAWIDKDDDDDDDIIHSYSFKKELSIEGIIPNIYGF